MMPQHGTFSALQALCEGNPPVTDECPSQRPVMQWFDIFFDSSLLLLHHSSFQWFEALWRSCDITVVKWQSITWAKDDDPVHLRHILMTSVRCLSVWGCTYELMRSSLFYIMAAILSLSLLVWTCITDSALVTCELLTYAKHRGPRRSGFNGCCLLYRILMYIWSAIVSCLVIPIYGWYWII